MSEVKVFDEAVFLPEPMEIKYGGRTFRIEAEKVTTKFSLELQKYAREKTEQEESDKKKGISPKGDLDFMVTVIRRFLHLVDRTVTDDWIKERNNKVSIGLLKYFLDYTSSTVNKTDSLTKNAQGEAGV